MALATDPDDVEVLIDKGDSLKALGKYKDAIQCFDKALDSNSDRTEVLIAKGDLRHALEISPYNIVALIGKQLTQK